MKIKIERNKPLKDLTTFKVGGEASCFAEVKNKEELVEAVDFAKSKDLPIFVLGGGSDILMSDKGFDGLVIRYTDKSLEFSEKGGFVLVTAGAGLVWDDLVEACVDKNLQGIECLSGIPGSVGAAPIQNIGAYGQELEEVFVKLDAYDFKNKKFVTMDKEDCHFSYRESVFKKPESKNRFIIIDITLRLKEDGPPTLKYDSLIDYLKEKSIKEPDLKDVRNAVLKLRGQKLEDPRILGNAGSFFKNPIIGKGKFQKLRDKYPNMPSYPADDGKIKLFAGWLIDHAGWKGKKVGKARVSEKNALVLTNPKGKAKAEDVRKLSEAIQKDIKNKFDIELEPEVQFVGFD